MKSSLAYQTADGAHVLIKSGIFSRVATDADGARKIIRRYAIKIYHDADENTRRMKLYESFWLKDGGSQGYHARIESELRNLVARRLDPESLENAIDMLLEEIFNEE